MAIINLKCSSCGANLEVDDALTVGFCQYCGAKYMLEEKINVSIKVDNNNDNKISMALEYIDSGNYEKADKIFKQVLEDDVTNHKAWWGRYICETHYAKYYGYMDKYGNTGPYVKAQMIIDNLKLAYNAIKNAPEDVKVTYRIKIADDERFIENLK